MTHRNATQFDPPPTCSDRLDAAHARYHGKHVEREPITSREPEPWWAEATRGMDFDALVAWWDAQYVYD